MRFKYALVLAVGLPFFASVSAQQNPPARVPATQTSTFPTPLYRMNDVGKSLNLTPQQVTNLNKLTETTQGQYRDDYGKLGTLNDVDRFTRMQELNQKYSTDWNTGARDVFDDTQRARYQQLNYQYGGFNSFYDPSVQKELSLTAEQQKNLRTQWDWSNQQLAEINRVGALDATKGTQMFRDYWTTRQERLNGFLTDEQKRAWVRMVGEPYTFQPSFVPPR